MKPEASSQQPATGRRRCGIIEHRRQIKSMQKWCAFLNSQHSEMWTRLRLSHAETENHRLRVVIAERRIKELEATIAELAAAQQAVRM